MFRDDLQNKINIKGFLGNNFAWGLIIGLILDFLICLVLYSFLVYYYLLIILVGIVAFSSLIGFLLKKKLIKVTDLCAFDLHR